MSAEPGTLARSIFVTPQLTLSREDDRELVLSFTGRRRGLLMSLAAVWFVGWGLYFGGWAALVTAAMGLALLAWAIPNLRTRLDVAIDKVARQVTASGTMEGRPVSWNRSAGDFRHVQLEADEDGALEPSLVLKDGERLLLRVRGALKETRGENSRALARRVAGALGVPVQERRPSPV